MKCAMSGCNNDTDNKVYLGKFEIAFICRDCIEMMWSKVNPHIINTPIPKEDRSSVGFSVMGRVRCVCDSSLPNGTVKFVEHIAPDRIVIHQINNVGSGVIDTNQTKDVGAENVLASEGKTNEVDTVHFRQ